MCPQSKQTILVASRDPDLADVRKRVLEQAGYAVIGASTHLDIVAACTGSKLDLVLIGYSLPPAEKHRIAFEVRQHCKIPVLELHNSSPPTLEPQPYVVQHHSHAPDDFLDAVNAILRKKRLQARR